MHESNLINIIFISSIPQTVAVWRWSRNGKNWRWIYHKWRGIFQWTRSRYPSWSCYTSSQWPAIWLSSCHNIQSCDYIKPTYNCQGGFNWFSQVYIWQLFFRLPFHWVFVIYTIEVLRITAIYCLYKQVCLTVVNIIVQIWHLSITGIVDEKTQFWL